MTLVVEDGTGVATAESYVSVVDCGTYAVNHGLTFGTDASAEAALRRATAYLDNTYRLRFPGFRTFRRAQALEWPRTAAYYTYPEPQIDTPYVIDPGMLYPFDLILPNVIPREIVTATCEAALREYGEPGALQPDLERGGAVAQLRAGPVQIRYSPGAPTQTVFQMIDAALSALIGVKSTYTARATRG